jgi:hypothetical protein
MRGIDLLYACAWPSAPAYTYLPEGSDGIAACAHNIGCPTSGVAQRAMREAAPHARGVSKARQLEEGWLQSKSDKLFRVFSLSPFRENDVKLGPLGSVA